MPLNDFELDQIALAHSRTARAGVGPGFRAFEVGIPKRPGSALSRPNGIDRASSSLWVEERTVAVGIFAQTDPVSHKADVIDPHLTDGGLSIVRD